MSFDRLTIFGLLAVGLMLFTYAMEDRSPWWVLAFAVACVLGSIYGFLQGAWPFGLVEAVWSLVAVRRWLFLNKPPSRQPLRAE
jgi:hypothetical protein